MASDAVTRFASDLLGGTPWQVDLHAFAGPRGVFGSFDHDGSRLHHSGCDNADPASPVVTFDLADYLDSAADCCDTADRMAFRNEQPFAALHDTAGVWRSLATVEPDPHPAGPLASRVSDRIKDAWHIILYDSGDLPAKLAENVRADMHAATDRAAERAATEDERSARAARLYVAASAVPDDVYAQMIADLEQLMVEHDAEQAVVGLALLSQEGLARLAFCYGKRAERLMHARIRDAGLADESAGQVASEIELLIAERAGPYVTTMHDGPQTLVRLPGRTRLPQAVAVQAAAGIRPSQLVGGHVVAVSEPVAAALTAADARQIGSVPDCWEQLQSRDRDDLLALLRTLTDVPKVQAHQPDQQGIIPAALATLGLDA